MMPYRQRCRKRCRRVRRNRRHVRLADLARAAGVSISTVARSLNGRRDVSASTRSHVRRIAERLRYSPNAVARSLVSQRTRTLGLLVNDCTNPFYSPR
jgi:DNA-binding LacI/PurR family transcriptional regulator